MATVLGVADLQEYARHLVAKGTADRVLALRAAPTWDGPEVIEQDGTRVLIRACRSSLAVRAALVERPAGAYLIVLTDRDAADLGESVTSRFRNQRIEAPDQWRAVAGMFVAHTVATDARALGHGFADALLSHRPVTGYPPAPAGTVTAEVACGGLLRAVLDLPEVSTDALLTASFDSNSRGRIRGLPADVRQQILEFLRGALGSAAAPVFDIVASERELDAVTVGLAADVLYGPAPGPEALRAQARLEPFLGGRALVGDDARSLARAARAYFSRIDARQQRTAVLLRAEQLLQDVQWPQGAAESEVLPAGFTARLATLGRALTSGDPRRIEPALGRVVAHGEADARARDVEQARMAVRLARWLAATGSGDEPQPATLAAAVARQMSEDSWVDRAIADVWSGAADDEVRQAYQRLAKEARKRRGAHDEQFARLLSTAGVDGGSAAEVLGVEDVLAQVVAPLAAQMPVALIVVDGMPASVAAELAEGAVARGWVEATRGRDRLGVVAALPTVTRFSRTSLLCGTLRDGTQSDEKREFGRRFAGAQVFHKDDLRGPAGEDLPLAVREAIASPSLVVGVVLNTVDDALAKADPDGTDWTIDTVRHLGPLLDACAASGRTVILTSDHGHVVERDSRRRAHAGAEARYRPAEAAAEVEASEVLLAGSRVLTPGGRVIAPAREDLRYGNRMAGYHGGATPAEVVVPVLVLTRAPDSLGDWNPASPQAPEWWLEPSTIRAAAKPWTVHQPRPTKPQPEPAVSGTLPLFEEEPADATGPTPGQTLAQRVVTSAVYAGQLGRGTRGLPSRVVVEAVIACLADRGGRAHRDIVARAAGIQQYRLQAALGALGRVLNVDGYPVIDIDSDGVTVVIDIPLLTEQFGLR